MATQKNVKRLFAIIVLANLVIVAVVILGGFQSEPSKPFPNPNGFDNFVKAGQLVSGTDGISNTISQPDLQALIAKNTDALALVRKGLSNECRLPNDYSTSYLAKYMSNLVAFKQLGLALSAEGKLAELEHQTNKAATIYLDAIRFGQESSRGGVMIVKLVGFAIENLGLTPLTRLTNNLDPQACRQVAKTLQEIDQEEPPVEENLEQEKLWARKASNWKDKIRALLNFKQEKVLKEGFVKRYQDNQLRRRQTILAFATRAYQLEKGKPPATSADLVPDYLKAIPQNPITGTNLVIPHYSGILELPALPSTHLSNSQ